MLLTQKMAVRSGLITNIRLFVCLLTLSWVSRNQLVQLKHSIFLNMAKFEGRF